MSKYNSAYLLSHNGLGDNITMIGAINFLLLHYKTIYFLCKDKYKLNVELLINHPNVIIIPFNHKSEKTSCEKIINNVYSNDNTDIFICGFHKRYLKSKITNLSILNYKQNNKYSIKWNHIREFYQDMNLDLSIYYEHFNINSTNKSIALYEKIKHLNIVFSHTQSSTRTISLPENIKQYANDDKYIIICSNENVYNENHCHFELANNFINIPLVEYIDVIKNACEIFIIDSCFSCIVHPLSVLNKLNAQKIEIQTR